MGKSLLGESILFVSIWCFPFAWRYTRRCSDCPIALCRRESKCSSSKQLAACKSPAGWEYCSCRGKGRGRGKGGRILMRAACQQSWLHWTWTGTKIAASEKVFSEWMTETEWRRTGRRPASLCGRLQCLRVVGGNPGYMADCLPNRQTIEYQIAILLRGEMLPLYHRLPLLRLHIMK